MTRELMINSTMTLVLKKLITEATINTAKIIHKAPPKNQMLSLPIIVKSVLVVHA